MTDSTFGNENPGTNEHSEIESIQEVAAAATETPAAVEAAAEEPQSTAHDSVSAQSYDQMYQNTYQNTYQASEPVRDTQQNTAQHKKRGSSTKTFFAAFGGVIAACLVAFAGFLIYNNVSSLTGGNADQSSGNTYQEEPQGSTDQGTANEADASSSSASSTATTSADEDQTLAEVVSDKCLPSVVSINVYGNSTSYSSIYDYLYGGGSGNDNNTETQISIGSGVVLSNDGYIVTNQHVIEDGTSFDVVIEGETYSATLVGQDASSDIAVLKVDGTGFTPIEIGDSDSIDIGEWVMSIGSPFGLEQSVATGIISAVSRSTIVDSSSSYSGSGSGSYVIYPNLIQTDAAINPGNSGGALVNSDGELIGINTLITSYSGNYSGVGFAIPSNYAVNIAQTLISGETPTHAELGVTLTTINSSTASRYNLSVDQGAYVASVISGSPAEAAGIQAGDIIISFDGEDVQSASDLMVDVRKKNPGDEVAVVVNRDGREMDFTVTLSESDSGSSSSSSSSSGEQSLQDQLQDLLDQYGLGGGNNSGNGTDSGNGGNNGTLPWLGN